MSRQQPKTSDEGGAAVMDPRAALARNVATARAQRQWSQTDLAVAAGITQQRISMLETGGVDVRIETVSRVARALKTTVSALLSD